MPETDNAPTLNNQIYKDKMKLTVTNIYPAFQKKSEQEVRQEIEARLYQIFKKYVSVIFLQFLSPLLVSFAEYM